MLAPVKQESNDTSHLNLEVAALKASLTAKTKLVAEQGKDSELTKLRKKNKQLKNEQPNGTVVEATGHQDVDQDMSDNIASNLLMPEHAPNATPPWPSNTNTSRSSLTVKAEPVNTIIQVVIKSENEPDLIERITFVKSEDGKFDVWNLKHLSLGPPVVVEEQFRVRFPRPVISDALGGGRQTMSNNWQGPTKSDKYPYLAMSRSYNPYLPLAPGDHGVAFCGVTGALKTEWGKGWVARANIELVDKGGVIRLIKCTEDGIREALNDGRLVINFIVMKCVGYRTEWFEQFLHYQAHPKPPKTQKRKKASSGVRKPSAKRLKGSARRKEVSSESDGGDELQSTPPGSDEVEFSDVEDEISPPVVRKSLRMQATRDRRILQPRKALWIDTFHYLVEHLSCYVFRDLRYSRNRCSYLEGESN
ncbi:hypothetical protein BD769DRAFT_1659998 [Suillus cothurnatus]|nr:hypothetical protein BD769DRAFT_1659998 [Suillus cothurnatus]